MDFYNEMERRNWLNWVAFSSQHACGSPMPYMVTICPAMAKIIPFLIFDLLVWATCLVVVLVAFLAILAAGILLSPILVPGLFLKWLLGINKIEEDGMMDLVRVLAGKEPRRGEAIDYIIGYIVHRMEANVAHMDAMRR